MSKYRCLDLYCCAGGASYGYELAGFDVVGVDINPQPRYRGTFIQSDAIDYLKTNYKDFDFIHASPPCQAWSKSSMQFRLKGKEYIDLIEETREALIATGKPYVIENVPEAPLKNPIMLCGAMFDIPTYRHRCFESNVTLIEPKHPAHIHPNAKMGRKPKKGEFIQYVGHFSGVNLVQEFTGLFWLGQKELAQSLPPQYTHYIGKQIINRLNQLV